MTEPLPETKDQTLSLSAEHRIMELCERKSALAIGPGLSVQSETVRLIQRLVRHTHLPAVIDADGLTALAGKIPSTGRNRRNLILTPHPGEMARLLGTTVPEIQKNRVEVARNFAREKGLVVVLKGARSIVASPEGEIYINPTGNPGMASGGMGDVLTGMVGGFLAQGFSSLEAAKLGVYLHGLVGDFVAYRKGERGMGAMDLIQETPKLLRALADGCDRVDDFSFPLRMDFSY
jgi:NAD(P)H-hydrate epimerase